MAEGVEAAKPAISTFERYLSVWVLLCIVVGIALGAAAPGAFAAIASAEVAQVNLPVAALIWLMIIPMLLKIDFGALGSVRKHWKGVGVTVFVNWAVKPFSMAALGTFFIGYLFARCCRRAKFRPISPGSSSSPPRRAPRWFSCGRTCAMASRTIPSAKSR